MARQEGQCALVVHGPWYSLHPWCLLAVHSLQELEIEVRANTETEEFLRKKQAQLSKEIQVWATQYDQDIDEQEKILEGLKEARAADLIKVLCLPTCSPPCPHATHAGIFVHD